MIQKRSFQKSVKNQVYAFLLLLVFLAGVLLPTEISAQGMTRINIVGVPSVLSSPYADQLEADFRNGRYQVVFNYTNASQEETDFVFDFEVFQGNQRLLNLTSGPVSFRPGTHTFTAFFEEIPFDTSPEEVVNELTNQLKQQIVMAGTLPEGEYQVRIQARPADGNVGMTNQQGIANFTVRYPQPPVLVTPTGGANVMQQLPTFSWTQVRATDLTTFEYEFLMVEVLEGQNPSDAIVSNRPQVQTTVTNQTTIPYRPDFLPLEEGATYAWQVRAADVDGRLPVRNEGRSEVYTFTYGEETEDEDQPITEINELEIIPLIPQFASLVNLVDLEINETSDAYVLRGNATLRLQFDGVDAMETAVNVQNIRLQKQSLDNPVILDGSVTGSAPDLTEVLGQTAGFVQADEINWSLDEGVTTTAEFEIPDGENLSATGELILQRLGPIGSIQAESEDVLKRLGAAPFRVSVTSMSASYPEGVVTAGGFAETFGNVRCDLPSIPIGRRSFTARVDCEVDDTFSLLQGSDKIRISIGDITGQFGASWFEPVPLSYNLGMDSNVELKLDQPQESVRYCGAKGRLNLSAEDGLQAGNFRSNCAFPNPTLNLGVLKLSFQNPDLASIGYSYELGWNFQFQFDANLFFPSVPEAKMPVVEDVTISPEGIQFPDVAFNEEDLQPNTTFDLNSFQFSLNRFTLEEPIFPWFDWDETGVGPWEFSLDAGVQFPDSQEYPDCLRNSELNLNDAGVSGQSIEGDLQTVGIGDCRWEFGAGYALEINQAGGELQLQYEQEELTPEADLNLDAVVELGEPFNSENASGDSSVDEVEFVATESGFDAQIDDFVPECPMQIGPYTGQITSSELSISQGIPGELTAELSGSASLNLGEDQSASGTFTLNPVTGEFSELDFDLQGPFEWGIPKQNSVLVFRVDQASLDENGISIDGRQSLLFEDETMGVTFDQLLVDWRTFEVQSGRIILDDQFSLEAGIDPDTHQLDFSASLQDSTLDYSPGVLMTLAGNLIVDANGLHATGSSNAKLNFGDLSLDDLEIVYSNDFAMRLDPFGVRKGQAEIFKDDQRIAVIDPSGFTPNMSFFTEQFLPDRIPLPTEEIAYLQVKDDGELLVQTTRQSSGNYEVETLQGQPLQLFIPALQGNQPDVPNISVTLTDLIVDPSTGNYISGSIQATVPDQNSTFDLESHGIPISLNEIIYTTQTIDGNPFDALFLNGDLTLLDHQFQNGGEATVFIKSDGRAKGTVNMPGLDAQIPLDPNSNTVALQVDSLGGNINVPLTVGGQPDFQFDLTGGFRINDLSGDPLADVGVDVLFSDQGFSVTDFDASALTDDATINLSHFSFTIDQISSLNLSYSDATGFSYFADLDFTLGVQLADGESIEVPLKNVDLRDGEGIVIPAQQINGGSTPALNAPEFDLGIFRLQPLAFRMDKDTIDVHNLSASDVLDLLPKMDLELTFPSFSGSAPAMMQQSLTLSNIGFDNGILSGSMEPHTVPDDPIHIPIGPAGLYIDEFSGGLFETDNNQQGVNVEVSGYFGMPDQFAGSGEYCEDTRVEMNLNSEGGFEGTVQDFLPCGEIERGPLTMWFGSSELNLAFSGGEQEATIDGTGNAEIERDNQNPISANGSLMFDLVEGEILSGSLSLNGPFSWDLPADDPLFVLTVQSALLNSSGLVFTGSGDLEVGDGSVTTAFNDFALSLQDGSIVGGSLEIMSEFAIDVSFNPTDWQIADPDDDVNFMVGTRFVMPPNLELNQSGLTVDGESSASLIYGEESYVGLNLDFLNMTLGVQPVRVTSGQADLLLEEDGRSTRLGWYDSGGFHPDNIAANVPMPDTLALPTKDIAYIVLKDEQGQNLVQSQSVSNGLELFTAQNESVPLVLAGLEDSQGNSPQVDISFSNVVIDNSYKVISGSITADVSQTPLNLADYGNYPLGLTALRYQKLQNQPHKLYADAKLSLPESIQDLEVIVEDIILGSDGFTEASFSAGTYTTAHTEGDAQAVASHEFSDGAFSLAVRGVNLNFGDSPSYQFSGDMRSGFLTDADGDTSNVHFAADYSNGSWGFALDTNHLTPHELPIGQAKLILDSIGTEFSQSDFDLVLDGRFKMSEIAGEDLEIGINGLRVGTSGVSVDEVDTGQNHSLSMFGQTDNFTINDLGLDITSENHLLLTMGGSLSFAEKSFNFSDFRIGTDGTFELGGGNANLIDPSNPVQLMQEFLVLNSLQIGIQNNNATLTASGEATLPDPIGSSSNIDISVDQAGNATISGPDFVLQDASADLGDFATFDLKGAGLQINDIHNGDMTLYASADLDIDGDVIEFGQPGSPQTYGIRYRMKEQKLEWNITNSPSFQFEAGFFQLMINNASLMDSSAETFGVSIDANANFKLKGIGGAGLNLKDFQISEEGIASMGQVDGGSFSIANTVSIEVGSFDWGQDEEIMIKEQAGSKSNPDSTITNIQVDEYLRFGSDSDDAVNITIPGGFEGGIEEIFYYRNSNSLYLNIEGVGVDLGDSARLYASLEYAKQPDGFLLRVAGGGEINSPSGQSYGIAALGEMSTLNNEFSFGIFVSVQAEVPLFPGVITITEVGGGFFYNAENEDFEDVLALTDYELYSDQPPWEDKSGGYDFAIALNAGASLIGQGGMYAVQGRTLLLITDKWIMMDVQGELLNQGDRLEAGVYLQVEWDPRFKIGAGIGVNVDYAGILTGEMNIDFVAVEDPQNSSGDQMSIVWAINGDGSLDIVGGIAEADASFMINQDGFYAEIMVSQGFNIGIISSKSTWEGAFWWLTQDEQMGAYVEIGFNATLFKVASVGGTLKGALLIDNGYLVYASASAYVKVALVFNGRVGVWLALEDGNINGGTGSNSEYESRVADAREQAQNMGERMNEAVDAAEDMQSTPEVLKISEETLSAAGQNLLSSSPHTQSTLFNIVRVLEQNYMNSSPQIHTDIDDLITSGESRPTEADYNISSLRSEMEQKINTLTQDAEDVESRLSETRGLALEWEASAQELLDEELSSPVQNTSMQWNEESDDPPSFNIDSQQASSNRENLEDLREALDELDQKYRAAIDSVSNYIDRIDEVLSTQLALPTPTQNSTSGRFEWEASDEEYQVGANTISQRFADASEAIDKFYGNYISYRWRNHKWASDKLNAFSSLRSGSVRDAVIAGNESMLEDRLGWSINYQSENSATFSGNNVPGDAVDDIVFIAKKRENYIHVFDPSTSGSEAGDLADQFESEMRDFAGNDTQSFLLNFIQNGIEFWYEMPTLGYEAIRDSSIAQAERMVSTYQNNIEPMETAHEDFTATVDEIYKSKASLTMTLREMIAIYAERRAALAGDSAAVDLNQRKDDLEEILTPPRIGGIQVTRNLTDYNNKITLSWNASHQSGNIVENSYSLGGSGSGSDVYASDMLSTGHSSDVTRYIFKTAQEIEERNMGIVVRVRGPSGTAISRPASFSAVVDDYGSVQPHTRGVTESIEEEDTTPPSEPTVSVEYNKLEQTQFEQVGNFRVPTQQTTYWTNQAGQIVFRATSFDKDTDIAAFEYALGSSKGATDIVDWTERQGRRVTREASDLLGNMAGADNIIQEITIQNVNLAEGPHYLSVRAVNGVGLTSSAEEMSHPINYDGDPPTTPAVNEDGITMPRIKSGSEYQSNFREAGPTAPEYEDPPPKSVETPQLTLDWSDATDSTSGVYLYEYAVSADENSEAAFANPSNVDSTWSSETAIEGEPLSFSDDAFIHIRAIDEAGNTGQTSTVGPVTPKDPTRPWTPKIKASSRPGEIGFYLYRPSMDWETEVDRYEFTASEGLFSDDLMPWTEVSTSSASVGLLFYALAADQEKSMNGSDASFIEIPTDNLPEGKSLVLRVRTVNGQGLESNTGWSGSVMYDNSPPKNPSITLSQNGDNMSIRVSDIRDPESGISKVEYKVTSTNAMNFGVMWSNFITVNGVQESTLSGSITEDISNQSYMDLRVSIRITNGNGMQTTVSQTPTLNDMSDSNQRDYEYNF